MTSRCNLQVFVTIRGVSVSPAVIPTYTLAASPHMAQCTRYSICCIIHTVGFLGSYPGNAETLSSLCLNLQHEYHSWRYMHARTGLLTIPPVPTPLSPPRPPIAPLPTVGYWLILMLGLGVLGCWKHTFLLLVLDNKALAFALQFVRHLVEVMNAELGSDGVRVQAGARGVPGPAGSARAAG